MAQKAGIKSDCSDKQLHLLSPLFCVNGTNDFFLVFNSSANWWTKIKRKDPKIYIDPKKQCQCHVTMSPQDRCGRRFITGNGVSCTIKSPTYSSLAAGGPRVLPSVTETEWARGADDFIQNPQFICRISFQLRYVAAKIWPCSESLNNSDFYMRELQPYSI